jgi:hypothetical protein
MNNEQISCRQIGRKTMRSQGRYWQRNGLKEDLASWRNIARANRLWHDNGVRLQKVPTPENRLRYSVRTDGFANRIVSLTGEACILVQERTNQKQDESQEFAKRMQVADESVVAIKSEPKKHS